MAATHGRTWASWTTGTLLAVLALTNGCAEAYSQFTHQELIDLTWTEAIRPLLLQRYPGATEQELVRAHAYAYGGCLIQDIGYYPFGTRFFSDLAHYARSGDFVTALLRNAATLDEFAFAVGALSHYIGDSVGHSLGTNPATAITLPDLGRKYGAIVTYEDAPVAHVWTEFGFDVAQTARQRFAARRYRKRAGFRVSRALLYRSFHETYGIPTRGILGPARSAIASYRWSVATLLPAFLAAEVVLLSHRLPPPANNQADADLLMAVNQSDYVALGMQGRGHPGIRAHLLAGVVLLIPKIGTLKVLSTKAPSTQTEDLFLNSAVTALREFRDRLVLIGSASSDWRLPNLDLDTGGEAVQEHAKLVDDTHVRLALRISATNSPVSPELRRYLLSYFVDPTRIESLRRDPNRLQMLERMLNRLRQSK
jgi:Zinc dependent phospholipase C